MSTNGNQTPAPIVTPKVSNMTGNSGKAVPNQFLIRTGQGVFFQSYETVIAFKEYGGPVHLDTTHWDYPGTTAKYRNQFLGVDSKKDIERKIKDGTYVLTDLN